MRVEDFLKAIVAQPIKVTERTFAPPSGWFTVEQIRDELNLAYTRNASSRALDLHRRGVLDRQAHQFKAKTGWVRIVDYAVKLKVSDVALRQRISRSGIKPKYFKTSRGASGLHLNAFYREADLKRITS